MCKRTIYLLLFILSLLFVLLHLHLFHHNYYKCVQFNLVSKFEMYVYRTCPRMMVETYSLSTSKFIISHLQISVVNGLSRLSTLGKGTNSAQSFHYRCFFLTYVLYQTMDGALPSGLLTKCGCVLVLPKSKFLFDPQVPSYSHFIYPQNQSRGLIRHPLIR